MPKDAGIKKWTTLATWPDMAVYRYFIETRGQAPDHALASLTLLRSKFDRQGNRVSIDKRAARASLDAAVIEAAKGTPHAPYSPAPHAPYSPAPQTPEQAPREETPLQNFDKETRDAFSRMFEQVKAEQKERDPCEAPQSPERQTMRQHETPKPAFQFRAPDERNAAGEPLAKLVAPWLLDSAEPALTRELSRMFEQVKAEQKERVIVMTPQGERREAPEGAHAMTAKVLALVANGANVMVVGPAGCGKTFLAGSVAQTLGRPLTAVSCSAGMSEAQLLGRLLPLKDNGAFCYVESPFMRAYRTGGVILLDEMDAADANLLLVINAALANGQLEIEARAASEETTLVKRHPDTVIMAATNTWGAGADTQYIGRGALDVSTLDRFYRLSMDYDHALERTLGSAQVVNFVHDVRKKARAAKLRRVVSTRMIQRLEAALRAGVAFDEACRDELASWSADERAKVGAF